MHYQHIRVAVEYLWHTSESCACHTYEWVHFTLLYMWHALPTFVSPKCTIPMRDMRHRYPLATRMLVTHVTYEWVHFTLLNVLFLCVTFTWMGTFHSVMYVTCVTNIRVANEYLWHMSKSCACHVYKHICDMHLPTFVSPMGTCDTRQSHVYVTYINESFHSFIYVTCTRLPRFVGRGHVTHMNTNEGVISHKWQAPHYPWAPRMKMSHRWRSRFCVDVELCHTMKESCHTNGPTVRRHVTQMVPLYGAIVWMWSCVTTCTHKWSQKK